LRDRRPEDSDHDAADGRRGGVDQSLAASSGDPLATLLGGTLALWSVSLIGILLGGTLLRRLPKARMHQVAAGLFLGFGVGALLRAWLGEVGAVP
jgi:putative Ca2+/H+ antiporter (TMEM165/GDT1 family)